MHLMQDSPMLKLIGIEQTASKDLVHLGWMSADTDTYKALFIVEFHKSEGNTQHQLYCYGSSSSYRRGE